MKVCTLYSSTRLYRSATLWLVALLLALALSGTSMAAVPKPLLELDRTRIVDGESVMLSLSAPGDLPGEPNLEPLSQDFDVLNQSQSSQTSIINGQISSQRTWQLLLAPKKTGQLTIPPLYIGNARTDSLSLQVLPAGSQTAKGEDPKLFIEVEAQPQSPYVQQQVIYTVRIFMREQPQQASLSDPKADNALLQRMGEDSTDSRYRDGKRYQVIERRYSLFPQASGNLRIDPPVLSAALPVTQQRHNSRFSSLFGRDPFPGMGGLFQETRPVRVRGKTLELAVQPQPATMNGLWLPAESLTLEEQWNPADAPLRVGEPITRTITIRARGLSDAQLPELPAPSLATLKTYPDQPQGESKAVNGAIESVKHLKTALIPSQAGQIQLPEIRLSWWDTQADQARVAVLPAHTLEVLPAADGSLPPTPSPPQATKTNAGSANNSPSHLTSTTITTPVAANWWPWLTLAFGLAWLATAALWWKERKQQPGSTQITQTPVSAKPSLKAIEQAFQANECQSARSALLSWAAQRWPEQSPKGLDALAQRLGGETAAKILKNVDSHLYAADPQPWEGRTDWRELKPLLNADDKRLQYIQTEKTKLPDLYPQNR